LEQTENKSEKKFFQSRFIWMKYHLMGGLERVLTLSTGWSRESPKID